MVDIKPEELKMYVGKEIEIKIANSKEYLLITNDIAFAAWDGKLLKVKLVSFDEVNKKLRIMGNGKETEINLFSIAEITYNN